MAEKINKFPVGVPRDILCKASVDLVINTTIPAPEMIAPIILKLLNFSPSMKWAKNPTTSGTRLYIICDAIIVVCWIPIAKSKAFATKRIDTSINFFRFFLEMSCLFFRKIGKNTIEAIKNLKNVNKKSGISLVPSFTSTGPTAPPMKFAISKNKRPEIIKSYLQTASQIRSFALLEEVVMPVRSFIICCNFGWEEIMFFALMLARSCCA